MFPLVHFILIGLIINVCFCNYVPVYIWGSVKLGIEKTPVLRYEKNDLFKNSVQHLSNGTLFVVFLESNLCIEDLTIRDKNGQSPFSFLMSQKSAIYKANVEEPVEALKLLRNGEAFTYIDWDHESLDKKLLVLQLERNAINKSKFDVLSAHNEFIKATYTKLKKEYDNVVAFYTGNVNGRIVRQADPSTEDSSAADPPVQASPADGPASAGKNSVFFRTNQVLLKAEKIVLSAADKDYLITQAAKPSITIDKDILLLHLEENDVDLRFAIQLNPDSWEFAHVEFKWKDDNNTVYPLIVNGFSMSYEKTYICVGAEYEGYDDMFLEVVDLLIKVSKEKIEGTKASIYSEDYENCIGFVSHPIITGIVVSAMLGAVVLLAVYLIGSIQMCPRFNTVAHMLHLDED